MCVIREGCIYNSDKSFRWVWVSIVIVADKTDILSDDCTKKILADNNNSLIKHRLSGKKERLFRVWRSLFSFCRSIRGLVTLRLSE